MPPASPAVPADDLVYPFPAVPTPGTWVEIHPDVHWVRMGLPFALDHVNLWLLRGPEGWTLVDTGFHDAATRSAWETLLPQHPPERMVVTHYHPDHFGQAGWLTERHGLPLLMTQAEYLTAHAVYAATAGYGAEGLARLYRSHGMDEAGLAAVTGRPTSYRHSISPPPTTYRRLSHGERLSIGFHDWEVIAGFGHSPEHASLYCESLGLLVSGDMLLPRISTNTSVWSTEPEADPVAQFLASIGDFTRLPADTLVLPSHGLPFRGLHARVDALRDHHRQRLAELLAACDRPRCAVDILPVLFRRPLDNHQTFFAMGEGIAHLNHLYHQGRLDRETGADGVHRFAAAPA